MQALLTYVLMAYMAVAIHDHSGGCADRATLEVAWHDAERVVIARDYPGRALAACGIPEDDPSITFVLSAPSAESLEAQQLVDFLMR